MAILIEAEIEFEKGIFPEAVLVADSINYTREFTGTEIGQQNLVVEYSVYAAMGAFVDGSEPIEKNTVFLDTELIEDNDIIGLVTDLLSRQVEEYVVENLS